MPRKASGLAASRWGLGRPAVHGGQDACLYDAHAMEISIIEPAVRRAETAGIEPAHAALETAVLPLNYVPEDK